MAGLPDRLDIEKYFKSEFDHLDGWNSCSISPLLKENLWEIKYLFPEFPTRTKLKTLLSILHLGRGARAELKEEFMSLLELAINDSEESVTALAEILTKFLNEQPLTSDLEAPENEKTAKIFEQFSAELSAELEKVQGLKNLIPGECYYLNKMSFESIGGKQESPKKHFQMKGKSKADMLREKLLSQEGCQKPKDGPVVVNRNGVAGVADGGSASRKRALADDFNYVPTRVRGMPRRVSASIPRRSTDDNIIGMD